MINGAERVRREIMIRMVREFVAGTLEENVDNIPIMIRPKNGTSGRCCVYHDRAVLKDRILALMGLDVCTIEDNALRIKDYLKDEKTFSEKARYPITVSSAGCDGCPDSKINVTSNCRGCFARPCEFSCPVKAIKVVDQHAVVDYSKCIKCGKCLKVCPFNAIIQTKVPCEDACPVGAIHKNEYGYAEIDFDKCISCGKCFNKCPFGAVMERSDLLKVLKAIADKKNVVAMVAPSAQFQFPGGIGKLFTSISKAGFSDVMEVALGAELTTENEAKEFVERMKEGQKLMTTSCCTAFVELVNKHVPQLKPNVSSTDTPMIYAAQLVKEQYPDAVTVFIGPCIAKRYEAHHSDNVDMVLSFEELGSILAGLNIEIMKQEEWAIPRPAIATARNFAKSCGVSDAVLTQLLADDPDGESIKLDSKHIDGIDKKTAKMLALYASGKLPANFLEVMSCEGGCVNGPCSLLK